MDSSSRPSLSERSYTAILDLNDDCLLEVFQHLKLNDLLSAGDVCHRFRENSQRHFASLKCWAHLIPVYGSKENWQSNAERFLHNSKLLRLFGASIKSLTLTGIADVPIKFECDGRIINLLKRFPCEKVLALELAGFNLTDELVHTLQPLLSGLQTLKLTWMDWCDFFWKMLPTWSPELRDLEIKMQFRKNNPVPVMTPLLKQSFTKLQSISFQGVHYTRFTNIEVFLKSNPQIKRIKFISCYRLDDSIFQYLAKHVPGIESICIQEIGLKPTSENNLKYIRGLRCLKSFEFGGIMASLIPSLALSILNEINVETITVERLRLNFRVNRPFNGIEQLIEIISGMKTLKTLWIGNVNGLSASHLINICKNLPQLSELCLHLNEISLSADNLLKLLRNADKLESLYYYEWHSSIDVDKSSFIDVQTYNAIVKIVKQRREKLHLQIELDNEFTVKIPRELTRKNKDVLSLIVGGKCPNSWNWDKFMKS